GPFHGIRFVGEKQKQPSDRYEALAHLRGKVALAAQCLEHVVVGWLHRVIFGLEDGMRYLVDLGADALKDIGGTVDDGVEQIHKYRLAGDLRRAGARQLVLDNGKRPRVL